MLGLIAKKNNREGNGNIILLLGFNWIGFPGYYLLHNLLPNRLDKKIETSNSLL